MTPDTMLDARWRGFPVAEAPMTASALAQGGFSPLDGRMALPLISLDEDAFHENARLMMRYVAQQGVQIAPHAKTPMSPDLAARLIGAGAWGATVADIRQAAVLLASGQRRLILGNEVGGPAAARRLAALMARYPDAELHLFVDSTASVAALSDAWHEGLPPLGLLVEFGLGRAGVRDAATASAVLGAILAAGRGNFRLSGLAAYEGAAGVADPQETIARITRLMQDMAGFVPVLRQRLGDQRPLILTAGGSLYFDLVLKALLPVARADGHAQIILRSGAIFFHDHGTYRRGLKALDARQGFVLDGQPQQAVSLFRPALRVWAELLSRPEPDLAIFGMGMRDVALDQGLPVPLDLYRAGQQIEGLTGAKVLRLNDQHAFVSLPADHPAAVGDVAAFGISHPCTCLDRHRILYGLDADTVVRSVCLTSFG